MKVKFCGAARTVTGSSHLLELSDGTRILLDCGLYQGSASEMSEFNEHWLVPPESIDVMILSHAHIDHSGRIPRLIRDGFQGRIYCTHATRSLCAIMLLDSAKIQESDAAYFNKHQTRKEAHDRKPLRDPLYTMEDARRSMNHFASFGYDNWFRIHDDVELLFKDAGHILGSASVTLRIRDEGEQVLFGFTGDIGRPERPILRDPAPMPLVDYLICESTYGNRDHDARKDEEEKLLDIIRHTCIEKKGKLIIPAFSVGRTQELVYMLDRMENDGRLPHIHVYVDSPLSVNATNIYSAHPECYDAALNEYLLEDENPFGFNTLTYIRKVEESKALNESEEPCIIISSSGMANAGRVQHHLANNLAKPSTSVLIVGYCAPHTPGAMLRQGRDTIRFFGNEVEVNAEIYIMDSFSAHGDRKEMLDFLSNQKGGRLKKLFLTHGEFPSQQAFKELLEQNGFHDVEIPELGQEYTLR
jgi:metallo-beta-lactamase family protein